MAICCCVCGRRIKTNETYYKLHSDYPGDFLCDECVTLLRDIKKYARSGNALYKAARKELTSMLNQGNASENALDYCESLIDNLNNAFNESRESRTKPSSGTVPRPPIPPISPPVPPKPKIKDDTPKPSLGNSLDKDSHDSSIQPKKGENPKDQSPPRQPIKEKPTTCRCKGCGAENLIDSQFCESCAAPLHPPKYCRFCGGKISPISGFCETCFRDRDGQIHQHESRSQNILKNAEKVGQSIRSAAGAASFQANCKDVTSWISAAVAFLLGLLLIGKMIKIPAMSILSGNNASFSYFEISKLINRIYNAASMFNAEDGMEGTKIIAAFVIFIVAAILFALCLVVIAPFKDDSEGPTRLSNATMFMSVFQGFALLVIVIVNNSIQNQTNSLIDTVITPTPLFYVSTGLSLFSTMYLWKELQYRSASHAEQSGELKKAKRLFSKLRHYKDAPKHLRDIRIEDVSLNPVDENDHEFTCDNCGAQLYGHPERCDVCGMIIESDD